MVNASPPNFFALNARQTRYVRVTPMLSPYLLFDIGSIANRVQIKNTLWHQFLNEPNQTRFRDLGTSNQLSDAFESTVAGPGLLELGQSTNDDVDLPYLHGYGAGTQGLVNPFSESTVRLLPVTNYCNSFSKARDPLVTVYRQHENVTLNIAFQLSCFT